MNGETTSHFNNGQAVRIVTPIFVDRSTQRKIIDEALAISDREQSRVIEFYGLAGIGKSRILEEVKNRCQMGRIPFISFDFMLAETFSGVNSYHSYKLDILLSFCDQLDHLVDATHSAEVSRSRTCISEASQLGSKTEQSTDSMVARCCHHLANALQSTSIVFMFDSFELCPDAILKWLWDSVLAIFEQAQSGASVIVFVTGRGQRFWESKKPAGLENYRTVESHQLNPFDCATTEEHTKVLPPDGAYAKDASEIHKISIGHPYSTERIIEWLGKDPIKVVSAERKRMAERLLHSVINEYILLGLDVTAQKLIQMACVPRRFDAGMLQSLALRFCPELVVGKEIQWYSNLLIQLQEAPTCAVLLGQHTPAYELEPTLRRLLHTALAILNPVRIKTIHISVIDLITTEITQTSAVSTPPADRVLEMIYHRAQVAKLNGESGNQPLPEALNEMLKAYYSKQSSKRIAELYTLSERLGQDGELAEVIGQDTLAQLTKLISDTVKPTLATGQADAAIQLEIDYNSPSEYKIRWNRPGQASISTQIAASGRRFSLDDWRTSPETIGKIAFRLFLPQEAQEFLRIDTDWYLQLTTSAPDVPWELLHDGKEFLSLKWPVARRANLLKEPKHPSSKNEGPLRALVIGDPTDNLSGAAEEARRITGQLQEHGIEVDTFVGSVAINALKFVSHLIERQYDLIHYAGHAYFDPQDPRRSGLLFSDGPFFAEELERAIILDPNVKTTN